LELIQLWIAEGCIQSPDEGMLAEGIGKQYCLLWRSFFQDVDEHYWSGTVTFKMHDLVHDLACFVARDEYCTMVAGNRGRVS